MTVVKVSTSKFWIPALRCAAAGRGSRCLWRGMTSLVAGLIGITQISLRPACDPLQVIPEAIRNQAHLQA